VDRIRHLALAFAIIPLLAGLVPQGHTSVWQVSRSPKMRVVVAAGCPATVAGYQDVVNTFAGPPLVPASPRAGLVCRYGGLPQPGMLRRQTRLGTTQAAALAKTIRALSLATPREMWCPLADGTVAVIALVYRDRPDVDLWYNASGCQSLDNGRIGAFEGNNPSFYTGFEQTINQLSPPAGRPGL